MVFGGYFGGMNVSLKGYNDGSVGDIYMYRWIVVIIIMMYQSNQLYVKSV